MALWNLISFVLVVIILVEAYHNGWRIPKFNSFATIGGLWFVGHFMLWAVS